MYERLKSKIPYQIKKTYLSPIKKKVDSIITSIQLALFFPMRKIKKVYRSVWGTRIFISHYHFVILCIKKIMYADLVINNINSLHYRNPTHHITVQCDLLCYTYLKKKWRSFDYPSHITLEKIIDVAEKGWQFFKVEAIINAAQNDRILFDADTFWHEDIVLDREKITLLASCGTMADDEKSDSVIKNVFNKPEWLPFIHHVAAFVSIPKKLMTQQIADDMRRFNQMVWDNNLAFMPEKKRGEVLRLSEEYAVNLSTQSHYPPHMITVLKNEDGVKNRKKMESLYYGCKNEIND